MDRKLVEEVLCAMCGDRQPVARHCRKCLVSFGAYACLECRFFEVSSGLRTSEFFVSIIELLGRTYWPQIDQWGVPCLCIYTVSARGNMSALICDQSIG